MSNPFLGQILMVPYNFSPRFWAFCNGQILNIAQNSALYALLGTSFGGNGTTTFALPDFRSRVPIHPGTGPGLSPYVLGQQGGTENVTLNTTQIPAHTHILRANTGGSNDTLPNNNSLSEGSIYTTNAPSANMNPASILPTGGNQGHPNIQPYLAINFIIALQGIFPSRS